MEEIISNIIAATIPNFCRITGIGRSKTYELLDDDTLESIKIGRRRLIILDSYRKLIERQRAAGATTRTGESQSPAPQPLDAAAKTACGCGETELANRGDLERPIEEVSAGISRQQQKPDHAYPAPPLAGKGTPIESKRHQTRNKFGQKSSARRNASEGVA